MRAFLARRLALGAVTLIAMSVVIFVLLRVAPGNIVDLVFQSAGLVDPASDLAMNEALFGRLFTRSGLSGVRLGDALLAAQRAASNPDVLMTVVLLGDPTMTLR